MKEHCSYQLLPDLICEALLLRYTSQLPKTYQTTLISATECKLLVLNPNIWLITTTDQVRVTIECSQQEAKSKIIYINSILKMQAECSALIGITRIRSRPLVTNDKIVTYHSHPVLIPFKRCQDPPVKTFMPNFKPIKLSKIETEQLVSPNIN